MRHHTCGGQQPVCHLPAQGTPRGEGTAERRSPPPQPRGWGCVPTTHAARRRNRRRPCPWHRHVTQGPTGDTDGSPCADPLLFREFWFGLWMGTWSEARLRPYARARASQPRSVRPLSRCPVPGPPRRPDTGLRTEPLSSTGRTRSDRNSHRDPTHSSSPRTPPVTNDTLLAPRTGRRPEPSAWTGAVPTGGKPACRPAPWPRLPRAGPEEDVAPAGVLASSP